MNASENALNELVVRIRIDQHDLDNEFVSQTNDFYHASTGHALAISLRDQAKNDLEVAEAEIYLMFRSEAKEKPTEAQLDAMVKSHEVRSQYFDRYLTAKLLADRWSSLKDSFIQKGHALRELAELYKLSYFGERTGASSTEAEQVRHRAYLDSRNVSR